MSLYNRRFLTCGIIAVVLLALGAMSASGASSLKITNCNKAVSRPKSVTLTCGDGNTVLSGLSWSSFGGTSAAASGTFKMNTCEPNCASGKVVSYPVSVKATSPRNCKGGLRVYNKVTLKFTGRSPKSASRLKNWTLGCPT
ncbi:MAG: hypothetical protein WBQ21_10620 [Solirubrobacteraceae bacterium]